MMTRALRMPRFIFLKGIFAAVMLCGLLLPAMAQAGQAPPPYWPAYMMKPDPTTGQSTAFGTRPTVGQHYNSGGAFDATTTLVCIQNFPVSTYTYKVVFCITLFIKMGAETLMAHFVSYMALTVSIMITFAIIAMGIRIASGEQDMKPKFFGFMFRLALVAAFSLSLSGTMIFTSPNTLMTTLVNLMDRLIQIVLGAVGAHSYNPWVDIDQFLRMLLGMGSSITLLSGLLGIVGAAFFSATTGMFMFMAAFMAIFNLLMFIFRVVFVYLNAVLLLAFMVILAPFAVPMALFYLTERYFSKWLHLLMYAILVPVLLFAFLGMFRGIFGNLIYEILDLLGGNNFEVYWKFNMPAFSWLMPADPYYAYDIQSKTGNSQLSVPAVQTNMVPWLRRGNDAGIMNMPGVDFGPNSVGVIQALTWSFFKLWIVASLFKSLVGRIPEVANNIARIGGYLISMQPTMIETKLRGALHKGQQNIMGALGGR